ncbi:hypothetical protein OEA41_007190 [Lepraria neglecta]|uniref:Isochorismatase-like domain-containing protein n=1 Tax=Lepraria neglecta TaxID=209136 RepID=A0AAD9ZD73_9LECA|nr:hypothetical protein OEA41_007190 [Lepraria neglecta]
MAKQSGKSFRSFLGVEPSKPTPKDSVLVIVDAVSFLSQVHSHLIGPRCPWVAKSGISQQQNEYDHGLLAISDVKSSRAVIGDVLKRYRDAGGDVVHLAEEFSELTKGSEKEKVIHKQHPSSFTGTDLSDHLEKVGKKKIVLAGYMAHVCISNTSRAGAELGYDVSVLSDGIGDRDIPGASAKQLVDTTLAELGDVSATVISSKDL